MSIRTSEMRRRFEDALRKAAQYATDNLSVDNPPLSVVSHFVSLYTTAERRYSALRKRGIELPNDDATVFYHLHVVGGVARMLEQNLKKKQISKY